MPTSGDAWQALIFEVATEVEVPGRRAFEAIYRAFLGRTNGPRAGWLLASLDPIFVRERAREASGWTEAAASPGRCRWVADDERRAAAAPRRAGRHPQGRHRQGRGPGRSSTAPCSWTPSGGACSARARPSRPSATPPPSASARPSRAARNRTGRKSRTSRRRPSRPVSGSPRWTPAWPRPRPTSTTCSCASPTRPTPRSRSVARRRTSRSGPGASSSPTRSRSKARSVPTRRPVARPGRASRTGSSARRSTSSTTRAAPRSPAPGSPSTRARDPRSSVD